MKLPRFWLLLQGGIGKALICAFFFALIGCDRPKKSSEAFFLGVAGGWSELAVADSLRAGAVSNRGDVPWSLVERERGVYGIPADLQGTIRSARRQGIEPLGLLLYGNPLFDGGLYPTTTAAREAFGSYARFTVESLGRSVVFWEIWNEWNLAIGMPEGTPPGRPEDYVSLLAQTYGTLKKEFPDKFFLGGSMAGIGRTGGWTQKALEAGMLEHLDGLSFHPYVYWMSARKRVPERGLIELVDELKAQLAKFPRGEDIPLYVTELGWPTHFGLEGVTLRQQAEYLSRAMLLLRADPRIRGLWIYTLRDIGTGFLNRESHFGLLFADGSPKPAWFAFRDTATLLRSAKNCQRLDFEEWNDDVAGVKLVDGTGRHSIVLWTIDEGAVFKIDLRVRSRPDHVALATTILGAGAGPMLPLTPEAGTAESVVTVTVAGQPCVIENTGPLCEIVEVEMIRPGE